MAEGVRVVIGVVELGATQLALAAVLILLNAGVSLALRLGLGRELLSAAARPVVQLALLALVLEWVFAREHWQFVLPLMIAMALFAGYEAAARASRRARGVFPLSMSITLVSSMTITLYGLIVVVRMDPWYAPQYAIPILGMILGNTLNGISLGLETSFEGYVGERDRIEMLLAHGATPREATREVIRRAVRRGMIPTLNMMAVSGIVSIPGMMTGQILAGSSPGEAAAYQIFILFSIAGGVALGTVAVTLASTRLVFDGRGRLRVDRIQRVRD